MAIHLEPAYACWSPRVRLPVTENAAQTTLLLPVYASMSEAEQEYVITHLKEVLLS